MHTIYCVSTYAWQLLQDVILTTTLWGSIFITLSHFTEEIKPEEGPRSQSQEVAETGCLTPQTVPFVTALHP